MPLQRGIIMIIKRSVLARIAVLYILFGAVIVTGIVVSFNKAAFSEGFDIGTQIVANRQTEGDGNIAIPEVLFDQKVIADNSPITIDSIGNYRVETQVAKVNLKVERENVDHQYVIALCLSMLSMLIYAAIFVVIFLVLSSLLKSIRSGEGFAHNNIVLTRFIAAMLIVASLLNSFAIWLEARIAAKYIDPSIYKIDTAFTPDFTLLITAVLIFIMAEVFAIGASLSDEQKLTI